MPLFCVFCLSALLRWRKALKNHFAAERDAAAKETEVVPPEKSADDLAEEAEKADETAIDEEVQKAKDEETRDAKRYFSSIFDMRSSTAVRKKFNEFVYEPN